MRLDKYLKLTRLIKRRSVAKELVSRDIFLLNNRPCKPSSDVKVGDIISLKLGRHHLEVKVLMIKDHVLKEDSSKLYEILKDEIVEDKEE